MKIKISTKEVGESKPAFVVAEAGINHNGSLKIAKKLIVEAKKNGADAIKFQIFSANDLASKNSKFFKIFKKLELTNSNFKELNDFAKSKRIIFFASPFSVNAVDQLQKLQIPVFKIASGDLTNLPLIEYISKKRKPIIVSTGMANIQEVQDAVNIIKKYNNKIILLHSVSAYPTPPQEVNLKAIHTLKSKFPYPIGFSDNGDNLLVPLIAISMGAKIIEKHFTLNKNMDGPDHKISCNPKQFSSLVKDIRLVEQMIGNGKKSCQKSELVNKIAARRSIIANQLIKKGEKISSDMIAIKRPSTGIEPRFFKKVIGRRAKKRINSEQSIKWNDIS